MDAEKPDFEPPAPPPDLPPGIHSNAAMLVSAHWRPASQPYVQVHGMSAALLTLLSRASEKLWQQARECAGRGEHGFAVIMAHAACEVHTEDAINRLLDARSDEVLKTLVASSIAGRTKTLEEDNVYRVYAALTNDFVRGRKEPAQEQAGWWLAWKASRDVRHAVAHRGQSITSDEASAAIASTRSYMDHLDKIVAQRL